MVGEICFDDKIQNKTIKKENKRGDILKIA